MSFELRTLDGSALLRDGREVALQPKRFLLLVYLLLETRRRSVRREQLLAIFWPESDGERARNALRQALHALRLALGPDVVVARTGGELRVQPAALVCDACALLEAVERHEHARVDALHRSDFLAGVDAPDAPELARWIDETRLRFRRLATTAVRMLVDADDLGPTDRSRRLERLLMLAPYDEAAALRLAELQVAGGERALAIETLQRFATRLRTDLEIEPSAQLLTLVARARTAPDADADEPVLATVGNERSLAETSVGLSVDTRGTRADGDTPLAAPGVSVADSGSARSETVVMKRGRPVPETPDGVQPARAVTPRRRGRRWYALLSLVGTATAGAALVAVRRSYDLRLVDVRTFEVGGPDSRVGEADVALRVAEGVRGGLAAVAGVRVRTGEPFIAARAATRVSGRLDASADGRWRASVSISAPDDGTLLARTEVTAGTADSLVTMLVDRVGAVVATRRDMRLRWGETLTRPQTLDVVQVVTAGMHALAADDLLRARRAFEAAWRVEPEVAYAGALAAALAARLGDRERAERLLAGLRSSEPRWLPLERVQVEIASALLRADGDGAFAAARQAVALEPAAPFLRLQAAELALRARRPRAALSLLPVQPTRGPHGITASAELRVRTAALHLLGRHAAEHAVVTDDVSPTTGASSETRLRLHAVRGDVDSLRVALAAIGAREDAAIVLRRYHEASQELATHGHTTQRGALLADALQLVARLPLDARDAEARLEAIELLLEGDRVADATALLGMIRPTSSETLSPELRVRLRLAAASAAWRRGAQLPGRALIDSLLATRLSAPTGETTYRCARLAALIGDEPLAARLLAQAIEEGFHDWLRLHRDPAFRATGRGAALGSLVAPRD